MLAEGILENPAIFSNQIPDLDDIALEYMEFAKKYNAGINEIKAHIFKFGVSELRVK